MGPARVKKLSHILPKQCIVLCHWKSHFPVQSHYNFRSWLWKKKLLGPIFEGLSLDTSRGPHFWKARLWEPPSFPDCYCDYKQLQAIVLFNRCLKPSRTSAKVHLSWRKSTLILWITILQVSAAPTPLSPHHFLMDHPLLFPPHLFILFLFNALVLCLIHPCIKYL